MFVDDRKARRDIGYQSRPVRLAVRDAVDWFRDGGDAETREAGGESVRRA
jgi:dihydroflavonol-4-reductase